MSKNKGNIDIKVENVEEKKVDETKELFDRFYNEAKSFTDRFMTNGEKVAQVKEQIKQFHKEQEGLVVLLKAWEQMAHELKEKK